MPIVHVLEKRPSYRRNFDNRIARISNIKSRFYEYSEVQNLRLEKQVRFCNSEVTKRPQLWQITCTKSLENAQTHSWSSGSGRFEVVRIRLCCSGRRWSAFVSPNFRRWTVCMERMIRVSSLYSHIVRPNGQWSEHSKPLKSRQMSQWEVLTHLIEILARVLC